MESLINQLASASVNDFTEEKEVNFSGRGLKLDNPYDARHILKAISNCPGMTTLRMDGNTLGIPAAIAISKTLEHQPAFRRALFKDMFTRRTENEIPHALSHISDGIIASKAQLVELDLSDNAFGPRGLKGIVGLLESSACYSLKELYLNNNGLGISGGTMLAEALCNCVANSKKDGRPLKLKVFVCGRNRLENEGATAISKFLKSVGSLELIAMPQNGIYHAGVKQLSEAFAANPGLKTINLEDNTLTVKGAEHIAKCLPSLQELECIDFGDCLLKTNGALKLAAALKDNCPILKEIYLGYNEISLDGGKAIVEVMEKKNNLEKLILNGNHFGVEGCQLITSIMSEYHKSEQLGSLSSDDDDEEEEEEEEEEKEEETQSFEDESHDIYNGTIEEIINKINESIHDSINGKIHDATDKSIHDVIDESSEDLTSQLGSPMWKLTPEDFVSEPTSDKLIKLDNSNANFLSLLPPNPCISDYLNLFITICSVVKPGDESTKSVAIKIVDNILEKAFKLSGIDYASEFNNDFIVSMGLLKGENKKFKLITDISGALIVLEHCVRQPYFNSSTKNLLQFFLSRPLSYVTASNKAKHSLLQVLYQV